MDRSPPPFFRQGPSANARIVFFGLMSLALVIADARFDALGGLRQGIGNLLYPIQRTLLVPRDSIALAGGYMAELTTLRQENAELKRIEALNAKALLQVDQLAAENKRLRELAGARERAAVRSVLSRWRWDRLVRDGVLQGAVIRAGKTVYRQEGRLGYEEYGAKPFALAGMDVREAQRVDDFLRFVDVDGVQVATDTRAVPAADASVPAGDPLNPQ